MKKRQRTALIIALCLIFSGALIFTGVMVYLDFDFKKLDNSVYTTASYEFTESVQNIDIDVATADVNIQKAQDSTLRVECFEEEDEPHKVFVEDNTLKIRNSDTKWYHHLPDLTTEEVRITVYVPDSLYITLNAKTSTGDINISDVNYFSDSITLECTTGDIYITNPQTKSLKTSVTTGHTTIENKPETSSINAPFCRGYSDIYIESKASTGDIKFIGVDTSGDITANTSTGDIIFENSDAVNIYAKASTGDIKGSIISAKIFNVSSSTGNISHPDSSGSEFFEAETSTGDIFIEVITE